MDIMNEVCNKYNISYVAVAGAMLGLVRHGGIIPWDNDIDIGFTKENLNILKSPEVKQELIDLGLEFTVNSHTHFHYGTIDCFLITLDGAGSRFAGEADTICFADEYATKVNQIFGSTHICAPTSCHKSLAARYKDDYFTTGNVNDNFHFKDLSVGTFTLTSDDMTYQTISKPT